LDNKHYLLDKLLVHFRLARRRTGHAMHMHLCAISPPPSLRSHLTSKKHRPRTLPASLPHPASSPNRPKTLSPSLVPYMAYGILYFSLSIQAITPLASSEQPWAFPSTPDLLYSSSRPHSSMTWESTLRGTPDGRAFGPLSPSRPSTPGPKTSPATTSRVLLLVGAAPVHLLVISLLSRAPPPRANARWALLPTAAPARHLSSLLSMFWLLTFSHRTLSCLEPAPAEPRLTSLLICLKRIYNFWCSMLVYTPFALCFVTLHGIFMHFLELTS
jgi:hypothetical protein